MVTNQPFECDIAGAVKVNEIIIFMYLYIKLVLFSYILDDHQLICPACFLPPKLPRLSVFLATGAQPVSCAPTRNAVTKSSRMRKCFHQP